MNLLLNRCGDIDITQGRLTLVDGADAVRQRWVVHMRAIKGEWFRNLNYGVPYLPVDGSPIAVTDKGATDAQLTEIFTTESLKVEGVVKVFNVTIGDIDPLNRHIDVDIELQIEGEDLVRTFVLGGNIPDAGCGPYKPLFIEGDCNLGVDAEGECDILFSVAGEAADGMGWYFDFGDLSTITLHGTVTDAIVSITNKAGTGIATGVSDAGSGQQPKLSQTGMNGRYAALLDNYAFKERFTVTGVPSYTNDNGYTIIIAEQPQNVNDGNDHHKVTLVGTGPLLGNDTFYSRERSGAEQAVVALDGSGVIYASSLTAVPNNTPGITMWRLDFPTGKYWMGTDETIPTAANTNHASVTRTPYVNNNSNTGYIGATAPGQLVHVGHIALVAVYYGQLADSTLEDIVYPWLIRKFGMESA